MKKKVKSFFKIFSPLILGSIVGIIIKDSIDYNYIKKPPLSPPSIVFPIAWSIIYLLMGISYYIFTKKSNDVETKNLYYYQLFFNLTWSILFFNLKLRLLSIFWIFIIIGLVILLMINYKKESKASFYLLIPYLAWLIFATYLNVGVYILN